VTAPAAQAYVIAHEYGHHVQNLLGVLRNSQEDRSGADSASVRVELQADCYAGVWANHAFDTGFFTARWSDDEIKAALEAAALVGDDNIQRQTQGRVDPDSFTHGTSAQRVKWFTTGFETGEPDRCDTFSGPI
jgi:predicted metalloprotease